MVTNYEWQGCRHTCDSLLVPMINGFEGPTRCMQAIKAAIKQGVQVILATGKARPAAIQACRKFGLEGVTSPL